MACNKKGFWITWRIENYNFFFSRTGQGFNSPSFVIDSIKDTSWALRIVANSKKKKGHMVLDITRTMLAPAEDLELNFDVSFFKEDDPLPLFEDTFKHVYCIDHEKFLCFIPHHLVYRRKGNEFIRPKLLIVRCKIVKSKESLPESVHCFIRTRIRVETTAFIGFIEKFSSFIPGKERILTIKSVSEKILAVNLNLSLGGDHCCKEKLWIEIIPIKKDYVKFCTCKVFLIDSEKKKIECGEDKFLFIETESDEWKFPLHFTKGYLMENSTKFLSNDTLTLKCEFAFSTGIEYNEIEDSEFGDLAIATQPKITCALEDLTCLFEEGILCDIQLQTATETFNAHKSILSARSSVFKSMLTTDMTEKTTECVTIEDLDANTVRRMLMFLYSDRLEDLDWESAKNLYYAADKYSILALKCRCSSFLKVNFQPSSCCEVLQMSDRHQDEDLKKAVQEYIINNRDAIIHTDQWFNLEKSNPMLVIETFRTMS
ncbi:Speckle-type POZ protein like [Argiope bruennichi]|uniref:Speckle-type POZ protein like n=1 Tax=Argiope bruennichi TaxID=94029 RepID=A0A8T0EI20_ARGBR|nr:Speckle-type POZ protein like [Argiope bruennichi]